MSQRVLVIAFIQFALASGAAGQYPPDPTADIPWSPVNFAEIPVAEIEQAFNDARAVEATQLGITLPDLVMPSQVDWDAMTADEQGLFLINDERAARGVPELENHHTRVHDIAQQFAEWLLANDAWGHDQDWDDDGDLDSPWDRLESDPEINDCHDFLGIAENLAVFVSSGPNPDEVVARSIYSWNYHDSGFAWGHRHACLWNAFNDNGGVTGIEGLMGMGVALGGPYQGPFGDPWPTAALVVYNVFDPCSTWDYGGTGILSLPSPPNTFAVLPAQPNPARRGATALGFVTKSPSDVGLRIYDVAGRSVRDLSPGFVAAGRHQIEWDGADARGERVRPGVYFFEVSAGDGALTQKIVVTR